MLLFAPTCSLSIVNKHKHRDTCFLVHMWTILLTMIANINPIAPLDCSIDKVRKYSDCKWLYNLLSCKQMMMTSCIRGTSICIFDVELIVSSCDFSFLCFLCSRYGEASSLLLMNHQTHRSSIHFWHMKEPCNPRWFNVGWSTACDQPTLDQPLTWHVVNYGQWRFATLVQMSRLLLPEQNNHSHKSLQCRLWYACSTQEV